MFSGTDNGLVTMTESVPLSIERFAFHLKLYNSFQALSDFQEDDTDIDLFRFPESFKVKAADIDIGCNFKRIRKKLEKSKDDTEEGKFVQTVEDHLCKFDMAAANSVEELLNIHDQHYTNKSILRNFYNSKQRVNEKRQVEIQSDRFKRMLWSKERQAMISIGNTKTNIRCNIKQY
jgi:hypothetical protein